MSPPPLRFYEPPYERKAISENYRSRYPVTEGTATPPSPEFPEVCPFSKKPITMSTFYTLQGGKMDKSVQEQYLSFGPIGWQPAYHG